MIQAACIETSRQYMIATWSALGFCLVFFYICVKASPCGCVYLYAVCVRASGQYHTII